MAAEETRGQSETEMEGDWIGELDEMFHCNDGWGALGPYRECGIAELGHSSDWASSPVVSEDGRGCKASAPQPDGQDARGMDFQGSSVSLSGAASAALNLSDWVDGSTQPGALDRLDPDMVIIDDRSYRAPKLQRMIFKELRDYWKLTPGQGREHDSSHQGQGRRLALFPANLTYDENAKYLLKTADLSEFQQKAYIVDTEMEMKIRRRGDMEPLTLNQTTWKSCTLLPVPTPPAEEDRDWGLGNKPAQIGYLECTWRSKGGGSGEDVRKSNPTNIKVYTFFWLTGKWLEAAQEIAKETTRDRKTEKGHQCRAGLKEAHRVTLHSAARRLKAHQASRHPQHAPVEGARG